MMLNQHMPKWTKNKTTKNFYKTYKKGNKNPLTKQLYIDIVDEYYNLLFEYLLDGNKYIIPYGMGEFRIKKYRPRGEFKPRNYAAEVKYYKEHKVWKIIPYQNFHTDGEKISLRWFNRDYPQVPNKHLYKFSTLRTLRKRMGKYLQEKADPNKYFATTQKTRINQSNILI